MIAKKLASLIEKRILKEFNFQEISQDKKNQLLTDIAEVIEEKILLSSIEQLSEENKEKFLTELEDVGDNESAIKRVIELHIPNLDEITLSEVEKYRQEILEMSL